MSTIDRLFNYEQGERLISAVQSGASGMAMTVEIPEQIDFELDYTGSPLTVRFTIPNANRVIMENITNTEPGNYIAKAYLKGLNDKWTDGTTSYKKYAYSIVERDPVSTSWENATDSKIDEILTANEAGELDLESLGWRVGDERKVVLSPVAPKVINGGSSGITIPSHQVTLVLMDTNHFDLETPLSSGRDKSAFVIGIKEIFSEELPMDKSYRMTVKAGTTTYSGNTFKLSESRTQAWLNEVFKDAFPKYISDHMKKFTISTMELETNPTGVTPKKVLVNSNQLITIFSAEEIVGSDNLTYTDNRNNVITFVDTLESDVTSQIEYFKNPSNITERPRPDTLETNIWRYFTRSLYQRAATVAYSEGSSTNYSNEWSSICYVNNSNTNLVKLSYTSSENQMTWSPFFCI